MRRGIFVKRISIETTWRACPQVFPGLQGHPSAGGHGGGYPDGEGCLKKKKINFLLRISCCFFKVSSVFFFFFSTGGYRCYQGVCGRWCQIFGAEKYTKGGEKHRQGCERWGSYFDCTIYHQNCLKKLGWQVYDLFPRTDKKEVCWNGPQSHPTV